MRNQKRESDVKKRGRSGEERNERKRKAVWMKKI